MPAEIAHPQGVPLRRWPLTFAGLLVLIGVSALAWFLTHRAPPPQPSAELTQKRLTFNSSDSPVWASAISPDGKYLASSDPAGIHIKLLGTGEEHLIPKPTGVPAAALWFAGWWFSDSTQLVADAWELGGHQSMWTVSVLGQSPHELRERAVGGPVSPDGRRIVFCPQVGYSKEPCREVWVMGSLGDNPQKVFTLGENEGWTNYVVRWSPDGQRLAYPRVHRTPERFQTSIETCDLKGANRTVVLSAPDLYVPDFCWLPDGRIVYSQQESPASDDDNLWQIGIDGQAGTPTGKPKRITQWAGSSIMSLSASGDGKRLAFVKTAFQRQIYVAELVKGGTHMMPARRLTNDEADDVPYAWTLDSKAVLFVSNRNGTWGIFKQGINQETAEPVVTGDFPRLSADGAWILYGDETSSPIRLMRIAVSGGVPQVCDGGAKDFEP